MAAARMITLDCCRDAGMYEGRYETPGGVRCVRALSLQPAPHLERQKRLRGLHHAQSELCGRGSRRFHDSPLRRIRKSLGIRLAGGAQSLCISYALSELA